MAAILEGNDAARKEEDVVHLDLDLAEMMRLDLHGRLATAGHEPDGIAALIVIGPLPAAQSAIAALQEVEKRHAEGLRGKL